MPASTTRNAIARQWELLRLLPRRSPGCTTAVLADRLGGLGFQTDLRTVQRDLVHLSTLFPLIADESARPFRWRWADDAELGLPAIDISDAVSLMLMEAFLKPLLPASIVRSLEPRFHIARDKLAELTENNAASRWLDKVHVALPSLGLLPPVIANGVLEQVQDALFADEQLQIDYRNVASDESRPMRVHPLALVQRGAVSYLVATIGDYRDPRLLAVHRITSVQRTGQPAQRLAGFSLDGYLASGALEFGDGATPVIMLHAWVNTDLAHHLTETPLSPDMRLEPDGDGYQLRASVRDTWQLRWWLLSQGAQIVVREPAGLRRDLHQAHRDAADAYDQDTADSDTIG